MGVSMFKSLSIFSVLLIAAGAQAACRLRVNEANVPAKNLPQMRQILLDKGYRPQHETPGDGGVRAPIRLVFEGRRVPRLHSRFPTCSIETGSLRFILQARVRGEPGSIPWTDVFHVEGEREKFFGICERSATQFWHGRFIMDELKKLPHCSDLEYFD